ncbi:MAG: flippase [Lachnospiraceae bacterium]|nr:flippase [Lachnospiraceae bacterium]
MAQEQENNRNRSITRNVSYNTVITAMTYLFGAVSMMYVSRKLQPAANGRVDFANSIVHYFVLIAGLGMPWYAIRCCARFREDRKKLTKVFSELFSLGLLLAVVSGAVLAVLCLTVNPFKDNRVLMLILGSVIVWNAIGCEWLYKGLERYKYLMFVSLITRTTALVLVFLAVRSPDDMLLYAGLSVLPTAAMAVCNFMFLGREVDTRFRFRINPEHLKPLLIFFAMSCMTTIYVNLDIVMLGLMKGDYETGLYSLVSKGKTLFTCFGGVLLSAAMPQVTVAWSKGNKERFREITKRSIGLIMAVNLALLAFALVFAEDCVLAMGGSSYLGATRAFRIMVISIAPIGLSNILGGQVLVPAGREKRLLLAEIIGAVVNLVLNLYVIPRYSINGASATTLISEVLVWVVCLYYVCREVGLPVRDTLPDVRTPIACAVAAVPVYFLHVPIGNVFVRLAAEAAVFFGVYVCAGLLLREPILRETVHRVLRSGERQKQKAGSSDSKKYN